MHKRRKLICNKGLTLLELVIAISILAIASSILVASYTTIMEQRRIESDIEKLKQIDFAIEQILYQDNAFEEIKPFLNDQNTLEINFSVTNDSENNVASIKIQNAIIVDKVALKELNVVYNSLIEYVDRDIELNAVGHKTGTYKVYVKFHKIVVAGKDVLSNEFVVTNSGNTLLHK